MEIVSKQDYWTTILNDLTQFGQISTEDAKFNEIANHVWRVLQNTLILTEDEKQIKHWEDIVNVSGEGLTQFQRKVNLLFLLSEKSYIPVNLLRKALDKLLGEGEYILNVDDENNKIYLGFSNYPIKGKVDFLLSKTIPSYYENEVEADKLPKDYLPADFLETTGTQTLRVDTPVDNDFGLYFDVTATNETAANNFAISMQTSEGGYKNIRISSAANAQLTWWSGGSVKVPGGASVFNKRVLWQGNFKNSRLLTTDSEFGHAETTMKDIGAVSNCLPVGKAAYVEGGEFKYWMNYPSYIKVYGVKTSQGEAITHDLLPALDHSGTPCMYDKMTNQTIYNDGSGQFVIGLTMHQAINLDKLPKTSGELTVSLPWEAQLVQHNGQVETALETARGKGWLMKVQYRDAEADSEVYNKYAACTSVAELTAVNADYKTDLTADGEWIYPLDKLESEESLFFAAEGLKKFRKTLPALKKANVTFQRAGLVELEIDLPVLTSSTNLAYGCGSLKLVSVNAPNATYMISTIHNSYLVTTLKGYFPKLETASSMCYGAWSLHTVEAEFPALIDANGMFHNCILNKESALRVLNSIPEYTSGTHRITIGIHIDNQTDEEVLSAIENTEAKGWTVTVQWNGKAGTSTASTYGLRRQPIYAKVVELDRQRSIDWGHYVTNWAENGYHEFTTVEEAKEYFGIEKETA